MIQSVTRYFLVIIMGYLVGKHVLTQTQADSIFPSLLQDLILILTGLGAITWSYFEKDAKGVLDKYFPDKGTSSGPLPTGGKTPPPGPGTVGGSGVPSSSSTSTKPKS